MQGYDEHQRVVDRFPPAAVKGIAATKTFFHALLPKEDRVDVSAISKSVAHGYYQVLIIIGDYYHYWLLLAIDGY